MKYQNEKSFRQETNSYKMFNKVDIISLDYISNVPTYVISFIYIWYVVHIYGDYSIARL